jgi:soluble lytic murein transglycosylase-like protein
VAWVTPAAGRPWEGAFVAASAQHGLPAGLLSRVAWQESRYDPQAYNAGSGASGMMQIVPRFHPGVDPWKPDEAIPYAAGYLRQNFDRFGSWELALAAYNAGPGNVEKYDRKVPPFAETVEYVRSILRDVGPLAARPAAVAAAVAALVMLAKLWRR